MNKTPQTDKVVQENQIIIEDSNEIPRYDYELDIRLNYHIILLDDHEAGEVIFIPTTELQERIKQELKRKK